MINLVDSAFKNKEESSMKNYSNIVKELTLEEKASLCSGLDFGI